jgi:hypothetical protein
MRSANRGRDHPGGRWRRPQSPSIRHECDPSGTFCGPALGRKEFRLDFSFEAAGQASLNSLVPKLCLSTNRRQRCFPVRNDVGAHADAKRSFADRRAQTELGHEVAPPDLAHTAGDSVI